MFLYAGKMCASHKKNSDILVIQCNIKEKNLYLKKELHWNSLPGSMNSFLSTCWCSTFENLHKPHCE